MVLNVAIIQPFNASIFNNWINAKYNRDEQAEIIFNSQRIDGGETFYEKKRNLIDEGSVY